MSQDELMRAMIEKTPAQLQGRTGPAGGAGAPTTGGGSGGVLGVVMARAGSKGLPGKALRDLLGKPVIQYTLEDARQSRYLTRVVVSSDDKGVLNLARDLGFETIKRPAALASDTARTDDVLRHAVKTLATRDRRGQGPGARGQEGGGPEIVVMLYGNVPIRRKLMIDRCVSVLRFTGCDSVQTIAPVGKYHPYWMFDKDELGRIKKHVANDVYRRQDLPPLYMPTGAVYAVRTRVLLNTAGSANPHAFLGMDRRGLVTEPEDSVDIDTEKDLWVAEALLRAEGE